MTEHVGDRAYDPLAGDAADVSDLAEGVPSLIAAITRSSSGIAGRGDEAIPLLVRHLGQVPDVWGAGMWLVAPDGATLRRRAFRGQHDLPIPRGGTLDVQHSVLGRIMRGGRPAQIPAREVVAEILTPDAAPHALRWVVGVPVTHVEEPLGILGLLTTRQLTSEEIALLTVLGRQVASEITMGQMESGRPPSTTMTTLVAQLAHELRTPLTGLRGNVQLAAIAARKGDYTRVPARLEAAMRLVDTMTGVIQNLQDLSRLERGRLVPRLVLADLSGTVQGAIRRVERTGLSDRHEISLDAPEPIETSHDPQQMEQVIYNVLINAATYSPSGGPITVRLFRRSDTACISIADRGIGIPVEELGRVFEPSFRGTLGRQVQASGLGLGLTISRAIVERHGGTIDIESRNGGGTTVTLRLPIRHSVAPDS
ncbi:GAF domain-containing sensor histidine kinase [Sphaerobacter thermophilus]|jgi:signal transduction histidine kinase|uniref:GAF domain-containing sensor histidine kinase n=1 Tax=Sphaerobacter thermophilus TaxID=2057 RepID=UPI0023543660